MAHAPQTANESADVTERRKGWDFFVKASKWFSLHVLGVVFFLIFWRVGHAPLLPTLVMVMAAVYIIGAVVR